jgi:hypothetical protein
MSMPAPRSFQAAYSVKILPGFMMFFGSSARLMVRIMSTAPTPASVTRKSILCKPMPCSPLQVPCRRRARATRAVVQGFCRLAFFGLVRVNQVAEVEAAKHQCARRTHP